VSSRRKKKTSAAKKKLHGKVADVDLGEVSVEVLKKACLDALGTEISTDEAGVARAVADLAKFYESIPTEDRATCDRCGGDSDAALDHCPFCGDADRAPLSGEKESDEDAGDEPEEEELKMENAEKQQQTRSLALAGGGGTTAGTRALDEAVARIQQMKGDGALWAWKLGDYIFRAVYKTELWKQRSDDAGKPKYKGFNQFCEGELNFTPQYIYSLMEVAENFTEEQAKKFNSGKTLRLMVKLDVETRGKLTEGGAVPSHQQVREQLEKGKRRKAKAGARTEAATRASTEKNRREKTLTILVPAERQRVKLWARPAKRGQEPKPARRLADQPYGVVEGTNGVHLEIAVRESSTGQLELSVVPVDRREE